MTALLFTSTIRRIEADGLARTGPGELMARAASAVADAVEELLREGPVGRPVFAVCGPGNNGGDALLATLLLHERGFDARAFELAGCAAGAAPPDDTARVRARAAALGLSPTRLQSGDALQALFAPWTNGPATGAPRPVPLVVDGLFGIGLARPLDGLAAELCRLLAGLESPVVAIDVPSGVDTDTGALVGPVAMPATLTVTMIGDKPGLHTGRALDHVGQVRVAPLELDASAQADGLLFGRCEAARRLPRRPRDSSKGTFGSVLVVGGGRGMTGAALLAARAAQYGGAGKVWIASPQGPVFDPGQPQLMTRDADAGFDGVDVLVAGCGLGTEADARALLLRVLASPAAAVLDADALNLLAADRRLALRPPVAAPDQSPRVLTPHPLEAARLADCSAAEIQRDRIGAASALAGRYDAIVVLKGAGTVVARPDGRWAIIDAGGPALATAGTGDVLAGVIGSLLAQRLSAWDASLLGCWVHGNAGDRWRAVGLSAAELPGLVRESLAALTETPT